MGGCACVRVCARACVYVCVCVCACLYLYYVCNSSNFNLIVFVSTDSQTIRAELDVSTRHLLALEGQFINSATYKQTDDTALRSFYAPGCLRLNRTNCLQPGTYIIRVFHTHVHTHAHAYAHAHTHARTQANTKFEHTHYTQAKY